MKSLCVPGKSLYLSPQKLLKNDSLYWKQANKGDQMFKCLAYPFYGH